MRVPRAWNSSVAEDCALLWDDASFKHSWQAVRAEIDSPQRTMLAMAFFRCSCNKEWCSLELQLAGIGAKNIILQLQHDSGQARATSGFRDHCRPLTQVQAQRIET